MQAEVHIPGVGKVPGSPVQDDGVHWYSPGPVARAFMLDDSFVCGIRGPFGSGKSVTCVMKIVKGVQGQARSPHDGWKRRRTAIIRNTYPELRTTTMNTWFQWIPKHKGRWRDAGPPMQHIVDPVAKLDWEILFVALDRPDDVAKLLSMELSDAWMNEAREAPKAIVDALTGRVGRYPAIWQGGCTNPQIMMDTNSPDTDHWWYVLAEKDGTTEKNRQILQSILSAEEELRRMGVLKEGQRLYSFHSQPSGRGPSAENLRNLRAGYYQILMAGKDEDWIKVYVDGEYGFVMDGKPVYPEYKDSFHAKDFPVLAGIGFRLGLDFGLTPAASISQRTPNGRWLVQNEFVSERMGILTFSHDLARYLREKYPAAKLVSVRGDPSGDAVTPEETTCFKIMRANGFPIAEPAPSNDPTRRREGVRRLLKTIVDGEPAIAWHRNNTPVCRKGMAGGFHYRRLQIAGEERYRDVPEKDKYSHIVEALEYDLLSGGEDRNVTQTNEQREGYKHRQKVADSEYNVFGGD